MNVNYQYDGIYMNFLRLYREAWAEVWELERVVIDHGYSPEYVGPANEARDRFEDIMMRMSGRERMLFGPDFGKKAISTGIFEYLNRSPYQPSPYAFI